MMRCKEITEGLKLIEQGHIPRTQFAVTEKQNKSCRRTACSTASDFVKHKAKPDQ